MAKAAKSSGAKEFTLEQAEAEILKKVQAKGAAGVTSLYTAKTAASKKAMLEQALAALEGRREVFVDRSKKSARHFAWHCRPKTASAESIAPRVLAFLLQEYPRVYGEKALLKHVDLSAGEKKLVGGALELLVRKQEIEELQLIPATGKPQTIFVPRRASTAVDSAVEAPIDADALHSAYERLVAETSFPSVKISALQQAAGFPMESLKAWLLQQQETGRVALSVADWSMATEEERQGVIDLHGRRYLQVRWL